MWHDILSNSIPPHSSNNNIPQTTNQLLYILRKNKGQIKAIVYNSRLATPDLFHTGLNADIALKISVKRHPISKRKARSNYYQELSKVHVEVSIETNVLKTVLRHHNRLD